MPQPNYPQMAGAFGIDDQLALFQTRRRPVVSAAATLTVAQSGSLCVWPAATGFTYTLPAIGDIDTGTFFDFFVAVTNTSVANKVICSSGEFLLGAVITSTVAATPSATLGPKAFSFDGTTHLACTMGGSDTTAGGVAGSSFRVRALNTTQWLISGTIIAAGTIVTPAATS